MSQPDDKKPVKAENENQKKEAATKPARGFGLKRMLIAVVILIPALMIATHEISVRRFQDVICVACHEMEEPVRKWKESGAAENHGNCSGCHFDSGFKGWLASYGSAVEQVVEHFRRDPEDPLAPPEEPLFLDENEEPGYWSLVPNHRCFQCHDALNHKPIDQPRIHAKLINDIASQPCKDCHNHEMRNGQKFYEKALSEQASLAPSGSET